LGCQNIDYLAIDSNGNTAAHHAIMKGIYISYKKIKFHNHMFFFLKKKIN